MMLTSHSAPRHWIGHWLMLLAAIHTVFRLGAAAQTRAMKRARPRAAAPSESKP